MFLCHPCCYHHSKIMKRQSKLQHEAYPCLAHHKEMERKRIRRKRSTSCASVRTRRSQVIPHRFPLVQRTSFAFGKKGISIVPNPVNIP